MVKHMILWKLKDEFTEEQKADIRAGIKEGLEGLAGQIPGMIDISVRTEYLPISSVLEIKSERGKPEFTSLRFYVQSMLSFSASDPEFSYGYEGFPA